MSGEFCCQVCGNAIPADTIECPYCGYRQTTAKPASCEACQHRVINLERGMPPVQQAMERLRSELIVSRGLGCRVLTLIHGYGSSGRGGRIRTEVRRHLSFLKASGAINDCVHGEDLDHRSGPGKQLMRRFPFLAGHRDLGRANPGITVVVL